MEVKHSSKEIPINSNFFVYNNSSTSTLQPETTIVVATEEEKSPPLTLDPSHQPNYKLNYTSTTTTRYPSSSPSPIPSPGSRAEMIRYRECQRNHAAHLGNHVVDGCGEFMPSGEEGTPLALKCAACDCHRNFHRREVEGETTTTATITTTTAGTAAAVPLLPFPAPAPSASNTTNCYISLNKYHKNLVPVRPTANIPVHHQQGLGQHVHHRAPVMMAFGGGGAAAESSSDDLNGFRAGNLDGKGQFIEQIGVSKKRFRTKFTHEQKDKMMDFAEKIGWKIQKQDDVEVQRFCNDMGVKRQVFKVWMHNNKQAMKKKQAN